MSGRADHKTRFSPTNQPVKTGRPRGSKDRLNSAFIADLTEVWEAKGKGVLLRLADDDPATFARVTASIQPKELEITDPLKAMSDEKLSAAIDALVEQLREQAPAIEPPKDNPKPRTVN